MEHDHFNTAPPPAEGGERGQKPSHRPLKRKVRELFEENAELFN